MWYRMPMGRDAVSEAKAAAVRNRMAAIRCTARLIARIGTRELDRALGKAVCQQLKQVEEALEGREEPSPLSPLHRLRQHSGSLVLKRHRLESCDA